MPERATFSFTHRVSGGPSPPVKRCIFVSKVICGTRCADLLVRYCARIHSMAVACVPLGHLHMRPFPVARKRLAEGENICLAADGMGAPGWLKWCLHHLEEPDVHGTYEVLKAHMTDKGKLLKCHACKGAFCIRSPCGGEELRRRDGRFCLDREGPSTRPALPSLEAISNVPLAAKVGRFVSWAPLGFTCKHRPRPAP